MRTTEERMALLLGKWKAANARQTNRQIGGLAAGCILLTGWILGLPALFATEEATLGTVPGLYGSVLLRRGAGGYVLVGVVAFAAGVLITVLCLRYKRKQSHNEEEKQ